MHPLLFGDSTGLKNLEYNYYVWRLLSLVSTYKYKYCINDLASKDTSAIYSVHGCNETSILI